MKPIGQIETPFPEKFGVPRQPLLVEEAWGKIRFPNNDFFSEAFRGIESFSHLWLIFSFHHIGEENIQALVRPPRFGGKKKWGVFATRSPHRPNRLGLSVVKFERLEILSHEIILWVSGVDLVSGTPVYDIKPYLPYADAVVSAKAEEFDKAPVPNEVEWKCSPPLDKSLIEKVISLDPRPSHKDSADTYGVSIAGWNATFRFVNGVFEILEVTPVNK